MSATRPQTLLFILAAFPAALAAGNAKTPTPFITMETSATNTIVREPFTAAVDIWIPENNSRPDEYPLPVNLEPTIFIPLMAGKDLKDFATGDPKPVLEKLIVNDERLRGPGVFSVNNFTLQDRSRQRFPGFDDPFFSGLDPFSRRKAFFALPTDKVEKDGVTWWHSRLVSQPVTPLSPGRHSLGSAVLAYRIPVNTGFGFIEYRQQEISSPEIFISVSAPPLDPSVKNYIGAYGTSFSIKAATDAQTINQGTPFFITLEISGDCDLASVHPPALSELVKDGNFKIYDDSASTETLPASRKFKYRVRPLQPGTYDFPQLQFSWYNVIEKKYSTVKTGPIPLQVAPAAQIALSEESSSERFPMPDGISMDVKALERAPLFPSKNAIAALLVFPPLVYLLVRILPGFVLRFSSYRSKRRRANALNKCLGKLKSRNPRTRISAIREYLKVKFHVNPLALTPADVRNLMEKAGEPQKAVEAVADELVKIETAVFSK